MLFKNEILWEKGIENNTDPYGSAVYIYAKRWANLMEEEIASGKSVSDIAEETSHRADTEGITGFMYGCAVSVLAGCWEWGEELRTWHNLETQINTEGEEANKKGTVLNPALLTVGKG